MLGELDLEFLITPFIKGSSYSKLYNQNNHNLLLSSTAEIDTRPELEIYQDEVKCKHGATVGQLDANMLFYLRARGIDELTAKQMLLTSFIDKIVSQIKIPCIKNQLNTILQQKLQ